MTVKTFSVIFDGNYGTIELDQEVKASVIRLKMYSILAFDIAGAVANPGISIEIRQLAGAVNDNTTLPSGIIIHTDVAKVHTIIPCDIAMSLDSPLGRAFSFTLRDAVYKTAVNFSSEIVRVVLTFEYEEAY